MNLKELLSDGGFTIDDQQAAQFEKYADLLIEWNQKFNLTAITEREEIYVKHFLDCLLLTQYNLHGKIADVGTGAGFPGIVLKIYDPDLDITMIEPNGKKITFLNVVINELQLTGIKAVKERSEDYAKKHLEEFDFVTSRAVAALNILSELCLPLVKVEGHFLPMKGPKAPLELEEAGSALKQLCSSCQSSQEYSLADNSTRVILDIVKNDHIASKYPRNYSQIKKKPL